MSMVPVQNFFCGVSRFCLQTYSGRIPCAPLICFCFVYFLFSYFYNWLWVRFFFSVGSTLALDKPFILSSKDSDLETSEEYCLEYGTATQLYLVPFIQNEEQVSPNKYVRDNFSNCLKTYIRTSQVSLALTQSHHKGPKLSRPLDPSQGLVVSQVFLPCDSQGSIDFSNYPFRVSLCFLKLSVIRCYRFIDFWNLYLPCI